MKKALVFNISDYDDVKTAKKNDLPQSRGKTRDMYLEQQKTSEFSAVESDDFPNA